MSSSLKYVGLTVLRSTNVKTTVAAETIKSLHLSITSKLKLITTTTKTLLPTTRNYSQFSAIYPNRILKANQKHQQKHTTVKNISIKIEDKTRYLSSFHR